MKPDEILRLVFLAAIWGGSYTFMRVVAPVFGAIGTMWLRILIGGAALLAYALVAREDLGFRQWWKQYLVIGALNSVFPFALIAHAMKTLPAGYGAILNALSPFFGVLFAAAMLGEKIDGVRLAGMAMGILGVAMIMNLGPVSITIDTLIAVAMSVAATVSYGFISVYAKKHARGAPNFGVATGALILPALVIGPLCAPLTPWSIPSATVLLSLIALGILCSGIAYILYYGLIRDVGPTKAISVTFLIPLFGVMWGAIFLDEELTAGATIGGLIVLAGMALVLGLVDPGAKEKSRQK
jgi:drug/metabolite transporter (DMT)-like permease